FAGWLFLILRNRCFAEQRRRSREGRALEASDEAIAGPDRPDGNVEQLEQAHALERALVGLTPEQREVFVLKHVEGLAYDEIAGRTGGARARRSGASGADSWSRGTSSCGCGCDPGSCGAPHSPPRLPSPCSSPGRPELRRARGWCGLTPATACTSGSCCTPRRRG